MNNAANDTNYDVVADGNDDNDDAFVHSIKCHTIYKHKFHDLGVIASLHV